MKRNQILLLVAVTALMFGSIGLGIETPQKPTTLSGFATDAVSRFIESPHFPALSSTPSAAGERTDQTLVLRAEPDGLDFESCGAVGSEPPRGPSALISLSENAAPDSPLNC